MYFSDRTDAGLKLAEELHAYRENSDVVVLGIPRGGVVPAYEVARELFCPLDITIARKIGAPSNPEYAIAAVGEDGNVVVNPDINDYKNQYKSYISEEKERQLEEIAHRLVKFRSGKKAMELKNKIVIIVDDGIATGSTMVAAVRAVKSQNPQKVVVAVPVGAKESVEELEQEADEVICLAVPQMFAAVGQFYTDFPQVEDEEVVEILAKAKSLEL